MNIYHFKIGNQRLHFSLDVKAHDAADALSRLTELLNEPVIISAWVGNADGGKTHFRELRSRRVLQTQTAAQPDDSKLETEDNSLLQWGGGLATA